MIDSVINIMRRYKMIEQGDHVVAGISGGADSVLLLIQLAEYRKVVPFRLSVVHINHLIREDASMDADFVRELCERLDVPFHLKEVDVTAESVRRHMSVEEAGRMVRYEAFNSLDPDKIATGHHRDDCVETFLLNLCRGTGIHGLKGIAPRNGKVIRPLIGLTRAEIEEELLRLGQSYRTDSTNLKTDYYRNRLRLEVIPYLNDKINDNASAHIASAASRLSSMDRYLSGVVHERFLKAVRLRDERCLILNLDSLRNEDEYILGEMLLMAVDELHKGRKDITAAHIEAVMSVINSSGEKRISLPYNITVIKSYDTLIFDCDRQESEHREYVISFPEGSTECRVELEDGRVLEARYRPIDDRAYPVSESVKWFDMDKVNGQIMCRCRREKDYLVINDRMQTKSLKDYMINEKIPKFQRDSRLLIADGSHIMWVIGARISEAYKISEDTKRVLEIAIKES